MFRVGQKVVCVDDYYQDDSPPPHPPVGTIATVSWVDVDCDGDEVIDLVEFPSPRTLTYGRGYRADSWKPLVSRKTDISIFTAMLNPSSVTADLLKIADFCRQEIE